ncbi:MAG: adenosylhomocysteinase [Clostridiales bacterium]|nr:adenosylhomocysteinase [Clostridiales bacterium]
MGEIRDIGLAARGKQKIEWARAHMPVLNSILEEFCGLAPFKGIKIALSVHLEAKTAHLSRVLAAGGAIMHVTGSNPLSTQDDVAAALAEEGMEVNAWHAATPEEYARHIRRTVQAGPDIVIDDGGDLVNALHNDFPELCENVIGGCEETTTGVRRLVSMHKEGALRFPMVLVNDARCKHLFDNRYGTGQSVWDGVNRTTNLLVAGKTVVVSGYGWCGKGVAMRAAGQGAHVIITEVDPVKALEAVMDGYRVMPMDDACVTGDVFITVTGCRDVITERHFGRMKDGALLCNAGHFDVEVDVAALKRVAVKTARQRPNIEGYTLQNGRTLSLLGDGRLVNLAAGDGHPVEIMDMSFAVQALCARYLVERRPTKSIISVPYEIDMDVARRKLKYDGYTIDLISDRQEAYMASWNGL